MNVYQYEYTDTFGGVVNHSWVERGRVQMPELTHYGYDGGTNFCKANRAFERDLVKRVKAELGLTGTPCKRESYGDTIKLTPRGSASVVFIEWVEE